MIAFIAVNCLKWKQKGVSEKLSAGAEDNQYL